MAAVPQAIQDYRRWIASHTPESWLPGDDVEFQLDETWNCYSIDNNFDLTRDGYEVNAWFRHDWLPLSQEDIRRGRLLLDWGRERLWAVVKPLSHESLERAHNDERWNINGILNHIGGAEWWYMDRLGLTFPRSEVPEQPFARLEKVRQRLLEILPSLVDSKKVTGIEGEFWSPRKLLRRAVWHEYDHTAHIQKLI